MQDELKSLQRQVGTTFVHVTHDQEEAMAIADRIVVMNAGAIEDEGRPDRIYREPATLFAADFMGEMNHIPAMASQNGVETPIGLLPLETSVEGPVVVCIRPEALATSPGGIALGPARVRDAAFFGSHWRAHLSPEAAPDLTLVMHLPPAALPQTETRLTLHAEPDAFHLYPAKD
jgi:spermidine/putrescine transport system ATP-binding protein